MYVSEEQKTKEIEWEKVIFTLAAAAAGTKFAGVQHPFTVTSSICKIDLI